jgi:hypothetical protein
MASPDRLRPLALLALALGLVSHVAAAQMYVCTTAGGHTLSGDMPPADCKDREIRVLNHDGSVRQVIPAPLTAEQRRARDEAAREKARREEEERVQAHHDRALLETYSSVEEIDAARRRALALQQVVVERAEKNLRQYAAVRTQLDDEAEFYVKRQVPPALKEKFESNSRLVQQQEKVRSDAQLEMQHINEKFDADAQRFRQMQDDSHRARDLRQQADQ